MRPSGNNVPRRLQVTAESTDSSRGGISLAQGPVGKGLKWGETVYRAIAAARATDGFDALPVTTPVPPPKGPFDHRPDPSVFEATGVIQENYAAHWGDVKPFGFTTLDGNVRELPPVPETAALDYPADFEEVMRLGTGSRTFMPDQAITGARARALAAALRAPPSACPAFCALSSRRHACEVLTCTLPLG